MIKIGMKISQIFYITYTDHAWIIKMTDTRGGGKKKNKAENINCYCNYFIFRFLPQIYTLQQQKKKKLIYTIHFKK